MSTRRDLLQLALAGAAVASLPGVVAAAAPAAPQAIRREIPSTGEHISVVGIGTNAFDVASAAELAPLREVLREMPGLGGSVIDTARGYGRSEQAIGQLLGELRNREHFFIATKAISAPQASAVLTRQLIDESFASLRVKVVDLMQIHSLVRFDELLPIYR